MECGIFCDASMGWSLVYWQLGLLWLQIGANILFHISFTAKINDDNEINNEVRED